VPSQTVGERVLGPVLPQWVGHVTLGMDIDGCHERWYLSTS
jgi:hypothetical protein